MNIILTGSTGYLGNKLLNFLENDNNNTLSIIRNNNTQNIKNYIDISDSNFYTKINKFDPDILIYTACSYENSINNYNNIIESNLLFPLELLNNVNVNTFIYIGTSLTKFTNIYSLSKHQFSDYGKYYSINYRKNFINIELENFYGEDEPENRLLSRIIKKLKENDDINLTEGNQTRDFIYINDVINGINIIINSNLKGYYSIPLGSGEGIKIKELVEYLKNILGSKSKLNFGIIPYRINEHSGIADLSIMKTLGFSIKLNLKDSIKKYMLNIN